jgi:hypothetical protein
LKSEDYLTNSNPSAVSAAAGAAADLLSRLNGTDERLFKNEWLAAVSGYMLFKRKTGLLGFHAGFVCGAIKPIVLLFN